MGHTGQIALGWVAAWTGWRDNPVARYWQHAEMRRLAARPWYQRSPGLLALATLLSLATTAVLVLFILRVLEQRASGASTAYTAVTLYSGTSALLLAGQLFAWCWLAARWFTVAQLALGFLAQEPQPRIRQIHDDLLAVSALSNQEVLAGMGLFCLRLVLPPLLLLNALYTVVGLLRNTPAGGWLAALGPALLLFVLYTIGGCLAALALVYLMISVSLTARAGMMPSIGAILQAAMQMVLPVAAFTMGAMFKELSTSFGGESEVPSPLLGIYLVLWLLVCFLLLYLARRLEGMRRAIGYAFPALLAGIGLVIFGVFALSGELFEFYGQIFLYGLWAAQFLAITAPLPVDAGALGLVLNSGAAAAMLNWKAHLLIAAAQLVLLVICAEFARDALRRRKWGKEGE